MALDARRSDSSTAYRAGTCCGCRCSCRSSAGRCGCAAAPADAALRRRSRGAAPARRRATSPAVALGAGAAARRPVVAAPEHQHRTPQPATIHQAGRLAATKPGPATPPTPLASTEPMTATPERGADLPARRGDRGGDAGLRARHARHRGVGDRRVDDAEAHGEDDEGQRSAASYGSCAVVGTSSRRADGEQHPGDQQRDPRAARGRRCVRTSARRPAVTTANGSRYSPACSGLEPAHLLQVQGDQEQEAGERAEGADRRSPSRR